MNLFRYKLMRPTGEIVSSIINLPFKDVVSAISYLEREGNTTIFVKKLGPVSSTVVKLFKTAMRKKVTRPFLAEFLNNVAMMMKAGIPIVTALEESAINSGRPDFESDIKDMIINLQGGASFSAVVEANSHIFPKTAIYLIRIGETTGTLDERLKDAANHLKRIHTIINDTKQALMYPSFVFISMFAGLTFWLYFVVPKIVTLFQEMDVKLPALTVFIINTSEFVQSNILSLLCMTFIFITMAVLLYKNSRVFKKAIDFTLLKLPIVGTLITASSLAFITEYFALLINAGIDILQSIQIMHESTQNEIYKEKLKEIKNSLTKSETIADSFKATMVFPQFVCRMINIGEASGTLSDQLEYIAEDYREKLTNLVATLGKMIEPIVLIVAGTMFAIIVAGLFLPIYDLIGSLGSM